MTLIRYVTCPYDAENYTDDDRVLLELMKAIRRAHNLDNDGICGDVDSCKHDSANDVDSCPLDDKNDV